MNAVMKYVCLALVMAFAGVMVAPSGSIAAEATNAQFSGISMKVKDAAGGKAVAVIAVEIPAEEDSLILPVFFEGDIDSTTLEFLLDGTDLEVLAGLSTSIPAGDGAYIDDINFLQLDVSAKQGQSGNLTVRMKTEAKAELFVIQSALPIAPPEKPGQVSGVAASDGEHPNFVKVTWAAVEGATKYKVYRAPKKSKPFDKIASKSAAPYKDKAAKVDKKYHYKVRACNQAGCGPLSTSDRGYR